MLFRSKLRTDLGNWIHAKGRDFMKKALLLAIAALMVPSAALAGKSDPPAHHGKGAPKVTYVLKGTLSNYLPYDSIYVESGAITIVVRHANRHGRALKGQTLTFPVDGMTKVSLKDGLTTITDGDRGIVKVRAAKRIAAADLAAALQAITARQVIDKGPSS